MKRILIYFLLSGLFIICFGRPSNAFEYESWPFEGMPVFRAKVDTLVLLKKPESKSPVAVSLKVQKDSIITFPKGVENILRARKGPGLIDEKEKPDVINEKIMLKKSIQKTVKPGIIRAVKAGHFKGDIVGKNGKIIKTREKPKEQSFAFKKSDVIEDLLYLGEGVCLFNYKGTIIVQEGCLGQEIELDKLLVKESQPITEWWVSIMKDNKIQGWFRLDNSDSILELSGTIQ